MTGKELKRSIEDAELSHQEFAELINYRPETLSRLINGPKPVPRLIELAAATLTLPATMRAHLEALGTELGADHARVQGYAEAFAQVARQLEQPQGFRYPSSAAPKPVTDHPPPYGPNDQPR